MKIAPIIDPSVRKPSPKPVRVDLRKVFTFGTALWAIALIVCIVLACVRHQRRTRADRMRSRYDHRCAYASLGTFRSLGLPTSRRVTVNTNNRQHTPENFLINKKHDARLALLKARRASCCLPVLFSSQRQYQCERAPLPRTAPH